MIDATLTRALEAALDRYLPRRGVPARLQSAMRYTLFNAGKRIRPALTLQVCKDLGGDLHRADAPLRRTHFLSHAGEVRHRGRAQHPCGTSGTGTSVPSAAARR